MAWPLSGGALVQVVEVRCPASLHRAGARRPSFPVTRPDPYDVLAQWLAAGLGKHGRALQGT
ncbi:hypothetical protein, partial [Kitasatospora sp. NPDC001683]